MAVVARSLVQNASLVPVKVFFRFARNFRNLIRFVIAFGRFVRGDLVVEDAMRASWNNEIYCDSFLKKRKIGN